MFTPWQSFTDARPDMNRLQEEMTRLFDRWGMNGQRALARNVYPALNLWEDAGHLYVEAELPGLDLNDLEIYITGENMLSIKGERQAARGDARHLAPQRARLRGLQSADRATLSRQQRQRGRRVSSRCAYNHHAQAQKSSSLNASP